MGRQNLVTLTALLVVITSTAVVWRSDVEQVAAAPAVQSGELLTNPGFEAFTTPEGKLDYPIYRTEEGGGHVAEGWLPWWYNDPGPDYSVPEYDIAPVTRDPYRVRSGNASQQLFRPSVLWKAGVYQRVTVPANASLRFTIWGHAWSSFCIPPGTHPSDPDFQMNCTHYHDSYWGQANTVHMKVGIDPTGGENWASPSIVWSQEYNAIDVYTPIAVEAQAQGTTVTVFTYSTFDWPAPVNNVYLDDASLVLIGAGATNPTTNTNTQQTQQPSSSSPPASGPGTIPTQPPAADGTQYHTVKSGETLGGIAVAYGVTAQQIRDLNGISGDIITVGQQLLIKAASAPTPTPEITPTAVEPTAQVPTATPQEVAAVAETGEVCVALFQDQNQDGLRDAAEGLVSGGIFSLNGVIPNSYTTDGMTEPHCFSDLPAGDYTISVAAPTGYTLVGVPQVPIAITGGSEIVMSFGVTQEQVAAQEAAAAEEEAPKESSGTRTTLLIVGGVGAVLLLASLGGLAAYFFVFRKRAMID